MIPPLSHLTRLTRAGFVFAREGVLALVDPMPLPASARAALRLARLLERSNTAPRSRLVVGISREARCVAAPEVSTW